LQVKHQIVVFFYFMLPRTGWVGAPKPGVTNVVLAGTRSPTRTMCVARGPVLKITLAWSMCSH